MNLYTLPLMDTTVADAYGCGTYGSQTYQSGSVTNCSSTAAAGSTTTGSTTKKSYLADTGTVALIFVTIACVTIFVALLVRLWRKPKSKAE